MIDPAARYRLLNMPLLLPILALLAASVISYAFGEYRVMGPQFIYRLFMGAMLGACVYEGLRTGRRLLIALSVFVAAGLVSAIAGLLEFANGLNVEALLSTFKPLPTTVGGSLRLSGTFEYANGAAMYFEMLLPLVLGMAMLFSSPTLLASVFGPGFSERSRRILQAVLFALCGIFMMALLLTYSRFALIGVGVALLVFGVVALLRRSVRLLGSGCSLARQVTWGSTTLHGAWGGLYLPHAADLQATPDERERPHLVRCVLPVGSFACRNLRRGVGHGTSYAAQ